MGTIVAVATATITVTVTATDTVTTGCGLLQARLQLCTVENNSDGRKSRVSGRNIDHGQSNYGQPYHTLSMGALFYLQHGGPTVDPYDPCFKRPYVWFVLMLDARYFVAVPQQSSTVTAVQQLTVQYSDYSTVTDSTVTDSTVQYRALQ